MASLEFSKIVSFFKALSDESRLKIVGILADSERSVEELAELLGLKAPTVSHHLSILKDTGLVTMRTKGTSHLYQLDMKELRLLAKRALAVDTMVDISDRVTEDAWERKVLNDFLDGKRLKEIPASRKKRSVILRWLVDRFEFDKRYFEKEVNKIIAEHHPDFATLRRELIGAGLLQREMGIYWRV